MIVSNWLPVTHSLTRRTTSLSIRSVAADENENDRQFEPYSRRAHSHLADLLFSFPGARTSIQVAAASSIHPCVVAAYGRPFRSESCAILSSTKTDSPSLSLPRL